MPTNSGTLSWHTGPVASASNLVATPTAVPTGIYYAAFFDAVTGCYTATDEVKVLGDTPPVVTAINGIQNPCSSESNNTQTYTNFTPGGVWSISDNSLATVNATTGEVTTALGAVGSVTLSYTVKNGNSCITTVTQSLDISPTECSTLPVKLASFNVDKVENSFSRLTWTTSAELNSNKFEIEHSTNGKVWKSISSIAAKGHSNQLVDYSFVHTTPVNGNNYYRLKMLDIDGSFDYSPIRNVTFSNRLSLSVYPNPAIEKLNIKIAGVNDWNDIENLKIYDMKGNAVYTALSITRGEVNVSQLGTGSYIILVKMKNGETINSKFVVSK